MANYQKVEYRIGKDGKTTETVIGGFGANCTGTTQDIESALGEVESQELLPEYYAEEEKLTADEIQSLNQT